jgi:hypothetical protein
MIKNKNLEYSDEEKRAIEIILKMEFEKIDLIRSVLHSATIKKGYKHEELVYKEIEKIPNLIKIERNCFIKFENVTIPENYSQNSGYTVDILFEIKNEVFLVDPKSTEHNNNTPISDEVTKWRLAKEELKIQNPEKNVRFILLKPNNITEYNYTRLKGEYSNYGIELYKTDDFLSNLKNEKVEISDLLIKIKNDLMSIGLRSLI